MTSFTIITSLERLLLIKRSLNGERIAEEVRSTESLQREKQEVKKERLKAKTISKEQPTVWYFSILL